MVEGKTYGVLLKKRTKRRNKHLVFKKKKDFLGKHTCRGAPNSSVCCDLLCGECENMTRLMKIGNKASDEI